MVTSGSGRAHEGLDQPSLELEQSVPIDAQTPVGSVASWLAAIEA